MNQVPASKPWHAMPLEQVFAEQKSSAAGLSSSDAENRLAKFGPNELQAAVKTSALKLFLEQFQNVLIIILLIATALSAFLGHGIEAIAITVIVVFAVLLGFIQEFRAENAIQALRRMAAPSANVLRDGTERAIPAREIVPGDVILLRAGDKVSADARLIEAVNLKIEEAVLTGESVASEKRAGVTTKSDAVINDRVNVAFAGTAVTYGRGRAIVIGTGMATEFGKIANLLQNVDAGKPPLQENLDRVGQLLARAAFMVVLVIVALGLWRGQPFVEMLMFGIALAVAVVPEALPAVVTISLAIGVQRMAKRNALMRKLSAVETLGSTSIICTDKTGTLTKDEMTVRKIFASGCWWEVRGVGYEPVGEFLDSHGKPAHSATLRQLLTTAVLASDAEIYQQESGGRWSVKGDPTEGALVVAAAKAKLDKRTLNQQFPRVGEIPFTSETKRMTTFHQNAEERFVCVKGAPEVVLAACETMAADDLANSLDDDTREQVLDAARKMADDSLRVLAIASKKLVNDGEESLAAEIATQQSVQCGLTLLGLVGMFDPPRPEAREAIQRCEQAGIKPVMITGDHPVTARAVGRELGLLKTGQVITGEQLEAMNDSELIGIVEDVNVFARVSPAHKLRVVAAFQTHGHVVAMTGDGVNDAPALKKADIGIAMGITGTDVTREAAAMTLTDDNFASIVAAVEEGRGIFGNIKKYLMYLLSSNSGEIVLMAGAGVLGLPLPLGTVQILYVNLASDGLPALALAVDPPEPDLMNRPPRDKQSGIFTRPVVSLIVIGGLWSGLANLLLFAWADASGRVHEEAMTMTFVSLTLIEFFKAFCFRSDRHSVLRNTFANRWLNLAILWEITLLIGVVELPWLQPFLGTRSLSIQDWCIVIPIALTVIPVLELAKWGVRKGWFGPL